MHFAAQLCAGAQAGKGADQRALAHGGSSLFAVNVGVGVDDCARRDARVGDAAVGANAHALAQFHAASEHAVHVDLHILAADQLPTHAGAGVVAQVKAGRVGQAHALLHQGAGLAQLVGALQLGQLQGAVHARHLQGIGDAVGHHGHTVGHGHGDDVGEVVLALGVVVGEPREPGREQARRDGHDAAVHLGDGALRIGGVFVLNDALHGAVGIAHDAAVAGGVGQRDGEQRQPLATTGGHQCAQGVGLGQGHIAREDDRCAIGREMGHGLLHGVAGAQLRFLAHKLQIKMGCSARESCGSRFYFCSTVAGDDDGAAGLQAGCLVQHMVQQRAPGQALQHFGGAAFHARALAGRHDENVE